MIEVSSKPYDVSKEYVEKLEQENKQIKEDLMRNRNLLVDERRIVQNIADYNKKVLGNDAVIESILEGEFEYSK